MKEPIKQIHTQSRNRDGAPRIHAALKAKGFQAGRHRVAGLMAQQGISRATQPDIQKHS